MTANPATLRAYALIFESPKECHDGVVRPASQACKAAAAALRFQADAIERDHWVPLMRVRESK